MKRYALWVAGVLLALVLAGAGVLVLPNPLGARVLAEAKYRGYLAYTPDEAVTIAYTRCSVSVREWTCVPAGYFPRRRTTVFRFEDCQAA
jgi:hypothetical protein